MHLENLIERVVELERRMRVLRAQQSTHEAPVATYELARLLLRETSGADFPAQASGDT